MSTLTKEVLVLNRHWLPVNVVSVRQALSMMAAGAVEAIDFGDENYFLRIPWEKWLTLQVAEKDDFVATPRQKVRAPRVVVAATFDRLVMKRPKLSLRTLRERDHNKCAYTMRLLKPEECSMEHVLPKSKGGETRWDNVVLADKKINNQRGNKSHEEFSLKLKTKPFQPKPRPFMEYVQSRIRFAEWEFFVFAKEKVARLETEV